MTRYRQLIDAWLSGTEKPPPIATTLGFSTESAADGVSSVSLEAQTRHHNAFGTVHGGVFCDLADVAMGLALASVAADDFVLSGHRAHQEDAHWPVSIASHRVPICHRLDERYDPSDV